jgi:hypothetical protein
MKGILRPLAVAGVLGIALYPGRSEIASPVTVTVSWDASPDAESYKLYQSATVTGPYQVAGETADTAVSLSVLPGQYFFYVTSLNLWGEGRPSATLKTPAGLPGSAANIRIRRN